MINERILPTPAVHYLTYRALKFAKASGECRPLSKLAIRTLSRLACDLIPPPPLAILGVELPLPLFLRNGLRLPVRFDDMVDETGIVALRLDANVPAPENRSSEGAGDMVADGISVGSGMEGRGGFCGAR